MRVVVVVVVVVLLALMIQNSNVAGMKTKTMT